MNADMGIGPFGLLERWDSPSPDWRAEGMRAAQALPFPSSAPRHLRFWNHGDPEANGADVLFLREHVLELPIHQDIRPEQVEYMARQVLSLKLKL